MVNVFVVALLAKDYFSFFQDNTLAAFDDSTDDPAAGELGGFGGIFFRDDEHHADAHVEDLVEFLI